MNSESFLKDNLHDFFGDNLLYFSQIKDKQLVNAANVIAKGIDPGIILALYDETTFNSGKAGMVFTAENMYIREGFLGIDNQYGFTYEDLVGAEYSTRIEVEVKKDESKVEHKYETLIIEFKNEEDNIKIDTMSPDLPLEKIAEFINSFISEVSEIEEETVQNLSLNELSDECIEAYLKLIINFVKRSDNTVKMYSNLVSLLANININNELQNKLRDYRMLEDPIDDDELVNILSEGIPKGSQEGIYQSVIDNVMMMLSYDEKKNWKDNSNFVSLKNLLNVTDEQTDFFMKNQCQNIDIIDKRISDKEVKKITNELLSFGASSGVSLAALGVTGMAMGAFEAGLSTLVVMSTGGLALAAVGIGAAGALGYKGMKYLTSGSELEGNAIRQKMLQDTLTKQNESMNLLVDDISYIGGKINMLVIQSKQNEEKNEKLKVLLNRLKMATSVGQDSKETLSDSRRELVISKLPTTIDLPKLKDLLKSNPKQNRIIEFILEVYVEQDDKYVLDESKDIQVLETADKILDKIKYNNVATVSNVKDIGKKGFNKFMGFLGSDNKDDATPDENEMNTDGQN